MISCTRKLTFEAGHRIHGKDYNGKCKSPHGHSYKVFVHASVNSDVLNELGMVVDFGVIKQLLGTWIDENWDHSFICDENDAEMIKALKNFNDVPKVYLIPYNSTAENLAKYLLHDVCNELFKGMGITIYKIDIWETENCYATAEI